MLKFAANISTLFNEYPFMDRFSAAKRYGFEFFEMQFPYEFSPTDIRRETMGMKCILMNSYIDTSDGSFGYAAVPGQEWAFCESLNKISPYYYQLGMQKVHVIAGLRDDEIREEDQLNIFVNNLKSSAEFLDTFDMTAVIEPLCEEVKPKYFLNNYDLAVKALSATGLDNVKLLLDIYHLHKITGDVKTNLPKYYPYSGHVQISQAPNRSEPYAKGGEIDYDFVFDFLKSKNHSEPIGLEYFPSAGLSTEKSLEWMRRFSV